MTWESNLQCQTYEAGADLSAAQFRAVEQGTDGKVTQVNAITDKVAGILQNKPAASGRAASVAFGGFSKMVAGGVIDEGNIIGVDNQGRGVAIVPGTDTTQYIVGTARVPASAAGVIFTVELGTGSRAS